MKRIFSLFLTLVVVLSSFSALTIQSAAYGNDTANSAETINVNQTYTDNILDYDDKDWFKFTLTEAGKISVSFTHDYVDSTLSYWYVGLYDADQTLMCNQWSFVGETTKTVTTGNVGLPAGTYYIRVTPNYTSTVDYQLKVNFTASSVWEKEYNDNYKTNADSISLNKTYYGATMDSDDEDWFKFTLTEAGKISVSFTHDYVDSTLSYWYVGLYDEDKTLMCNQWSFVGETTKTVTTGNVGLPAGTYYIRVTPNYTSTVDYQLKVNFTASSVWEKEYNDNYKTNADFISLNKTYYGATMDSDDEDWFKFTLTEAGKISVSFTHGFVDSTLSYWYVGLYDEERTLMFNQWSYVGETTKTVTTGNVGLPAGTYYIRVTPNYTSTVDYQLKVNFTASSVWEKEYNDNYNTNADSISLNKTYYGATTDSDDEDWFKFKLSSKKRICINFSHDYVDSSLNYWYVGLYDADRTLVTSEWSYKGEDTSKTKTQYITLPAGTYYVRVRPNYSSSVDYQLMVSEYLAKPKLKAISNTEYGVKITWGKVSNASSYRIYRKTSGGSWKYLDSTKNTYFTDKTAKSGTKYYYAVRAKKGETISSLSSSLSKYYLADPTLNTPSSSTSGIGLRWSKVTGAEGYIIYRKTGSGSYTKLKTEKGVSNLTYRDASAQKGKKYTYKVKAYKSKTYSAYSNTKTITDRY